MVSPATRLHRMMRSIAAALAAGAALAALASLLALGCAPQNQGGPGAISSVADLNPADSNTVLAQVSLERINRARLKPAAEAAMLGIDLNEGVPAGELISPDPKQPLTLNASLSQAAGQHSLDMLNRDYFAHVTPEGVTPFQRMVNAGYAFTAAGENLVWRGVTGVLNDVLTLEQEHNDLFVDSGIAGRGHRTTMLTDRFREVGIGIVRGAYTDVGATYDTLMQTQDYGEAPGGGMFVLGVVYNDANANRQYDFGEGVSGSTVMLNDASRTTNAAGGYAFEVLAAGAYTLRFAIGPSQSLVIDPASPNVKVDLLDGVEIVVNLGLGQLP